jgi:hypothetical protein
LSTLEHDARSFLASIPDDIKPTHIHPQLDGESAYDWFKNDKGHRLQGKLYSDVDRVKVKARRGYFVYRFLDGELSRPPVVIKVDDKEAIEKFFAVVREFMKP